MRLLLSSNAPWSNTGYGVGVKSLVPRLAALPGMEGPDAVAVHAWYGLAGGVQQWGPHTIYPGYGDPYGTDVVGKHARHHRATHVVSLIDVWTQAHVAERVAPAAWLPYFPVDTDPVSPRVLECLAGAHTPVVYSRFGERMLRDAGFSCAYVPHGVEPDVFRVWPEEEARALREEMFPGATHVSVMVAANKGFDRKAFTVQLRAWSSFAAEEPGAVLYIHTDPTTATAGVDLEALVQALDIEGRVIFPDRYTYTMIGYPAEYLAGVYNAADVLLAASMTEGFGIPIIEAQACGTPVITTDFASMPELVRWGTAVGPLDLFWVDRLGSWWAWPDWKGIRDALGNAGRMKWAASQAKREAVAGSIHKQYGWDTVVEQHWKRVLEQVAGLGDGVGG